VDQRVHSSKLLYVAAHQVSWDDSPDQFDHTIDYATDAI
jgi:hypothetical protein